MAHDPSARTTAETAPQSVTRTDAETHAGRGLSRRRALTGVATLGLATPVLAACGSDSTSTTAEPAATTAPASPAATGPITATADVPVGSGLILEDAGVVVTQPTEGDFKGFSNICTHQSCPVTNVEGGTINCTCHGSKFSIEDGSVQAGPAPEPLPAVEVTVDGDQVSLA